MVLTTFVCLNKLLYNQLQSTLTCFQYLFVMGMCADLDNASARLRKSSMDAVVIPTLYVYRSAVGKVNYLLAIACNIVDDQAHTSGSETSTCKCHLVLT